MNAQQVGRWCLSWMILGLLQGCQTPRVVTGVSGPGTALQPITRAMQTGTLPFAELSEASGLTASGRDVHRLWAINDGGNTPALYALTRDGQPVGRWPVDVPNRDWEALTSFPLNGEPYLMIADIGDNLRRHETYSLHLIREPEDDGRAPAALTPDWTVRFRYEDGPHNAEALTLIDGKILIVTKEPVGAAGPVRSGVYALPLPDLTGPDANQRTVAVARRVATMHAPAANFEARLAARLASVDLNHVTALETDPDTDTLWALTYRHIVRFDRAPDDSWAQALRKPGQRTHAHSLTQAESLAITRDSLIWFTSEGTGSALWVLPP